MATSSLGTDLRSWRTGEESQGYVANNQRTKEKWPAGEQESFSQRKTKKKKKDKTYFQRIEGE